MRVPTTCPPYPGAISPVPPCPPRASTFIEVTPTGTVHAHAPTGKISVAPLGDVAGSQLGIETFFTSELLDAVPVPQRFTAEILKI